ncbi:hypothetical protein, partial [Priestia aryabhattai]|uniref:hypothetical protein n=2 Tax=Priestia TaxID=2800373 RepID=UPI000653F858
AEQKAQEDADKKAEEEAQKAQEEADAQAKADAEAAAQAQADAQADADAQAKQEKIYAAYEAVSDMQGWISPEAQQKIEAELASSGDGSSETLDHCFNVYNGDEADTESLFCSNQE